MSARKMRRDERPGRATRRKEGRRSARNESAATPPPLSALDFTQSVFRDETQPMALRVSMAKAALPYMHTRAVAPKPGEDRARNDRENLPWPFHHDDPYGAIRPDWRDALERAGLIPTVAEQQAEAGMAPRAQTPPGRSFHARPPSPEGEGEEELRDVAPSPAPFDDAHLARARAAPRYDLWPDVPFTPRKRKLPDRANRSPREAEENAWRWR